jgi:ornithine decarboxylase
VSVPVHWPTALSPDRLEIIDVPTPYLVTDLDTVTERYDAFRRALPGVRAHYAMKCNPSPEVLAMLAGRGAGFEIASLGELRMLERAGVDPADVLYSNPVKPPAHIAAAHRAGLWRFSFDSPNELAKIAEEAPGSAVYLRLRVDDRASVFPLSRKFGTDVEDAFDLMLLAERLGLRPYGITFHVGSQCGNPLAWRDAIADAGRLMSRLSAELITIEMLDLGGGFPARYVASAPSLAEIGTVVRQALAELPYRPALITAEPGRCLVAEAGVLATGVIGREQRGEEHWLFVDVSAYHGLMETRQTANRWAYPLATSLLDDAAGPMLPFTVTGPTCDPSDTMFTDVWLPATIDVGDRLYIGSSGAYTLAYASEFNGFPAPTPLFVGGFDPASLFTGPTLAGSPSAGLVVAARAV